ncbi:MAG: UDP-N-acetylenolpyruvoylglucosamine reductase, partial [Burkholderiaceae bacterium]
MSLRRLNTLGLPAVADHLVRVDSEASVRRVVDHPRWGRVPKLVLGGGSNLVFTRAPQALVVKVAVPGLRV